MIANPQAPGRGDQRTLGQYSTFFSKSKFFTYRKSAPLPSRQDRLVLIRAAKAQLRCLIYSPRRPTITTFSRFARFEHDACVVWCGAKRRDRRRRGELSFWRSQNQMFSISKPEPIDPAFQGLGVLKFSDKYCKVLKNKIL